MSHRLAGVSHRCQKIQKSAFCGHVGGVKNLNIKKLSNNVFQHISFKRVEPWGLVETSGLVVINGTEAHMIDTPWTTQATIELIAWIETKGLTIKSTVVTHFHEDSSNDLTLLNDLKIKTYATSLTNKLLKSNQKETSSDEISSNTFEFIDIPDRKLRASLRNCNIIW